MRAVGYKTREKKTMTCHHCDEDYLCEDFCVAPEYCNCECHKSR